MIAGLYLIAFNIDVEMPTRVGTVAKVWKSHGTNQDIMEVPRLALQRLPSSYRGRWQGTLKDTRVQEGRPWKGP